MKKCCFLTALLAVLVWALPVRAGVLDGLKHVDNAQELKDGNCYFIVSDRTAYNGSSTTTPKAMATLQESFTVNWGSSYVYWGDLNPESEGFLWKAVAMDGGLWAFQNMENEKYLGNMNEGEPDIIFSDTPVGYTLTDIAGGGGKFYLTTDESEHSIHVQGYLRNDRPNNSVAKQNVGDDDYSEDVAENGYPGRWHFYVASEATHTITVKGEALLKAASQISSNDRIEASWGNSSDFSAWLDQNPSTIVHLTDQPSNPQILYFDLEPPTSGGEDGPSGVPTATARRQVSNVIIEWTTRPSGYQDTPHTFTLYGSNNGEDWTEVTTVEAAGAPASAGTQYTLDPIDLGASYSYLRLDVNKTWGVVNGNRSRSFLAMAEFQLYEAVTGTAGTVKYVVEDAEGNVLDENSEELIEGTEVTTMPNEYKKDYTAYVAGDAVTVVGGGTVTLTSVATPDFPFELGTDYVLKMRKTKGVVVNKDGSVVFNASYSVQDAIDGQMWSVEGDAYNGVSLKHKATGKYLTPGTPVTLTDNSEPAWDIYDSRANNGLGGFVIKEKNTELNYIHDLSNSFTYWNNVAAMSDEGSQIQTIKPGKLANDLIAALKACEDVGVLYGITSKEAAAALPDDVSDKSLEEIMALVDPVQISLKTGYYRMSNDARVNTVHYARVKTNDKLWADAEEADAMADLGSIFRFDVEGNAATVQGQCKYIQPVTTYSNDNIWMKDEPFVIPINQVSGKAKATFWLTDGKNGNYPSYQYMHQRSDRGFDMCTWNAGDAASQWVVYPVTTVDVSMTVIGDKAYAALNAPFGFTTPEGVQANTVKLNYDKDGAELVPVSGPIPANTPVILTGPATAATATVTLTTDEAQITGNELVGTLQATEVPAGAYVLTDVEGEAKLVPSTEAATIANVAYLPAGLTEAEALPFVEPSETHIMSLDEVNENRIYVIKAPRGYMAIGERNNGATTYLVTRTAEGATDRPDTLMAFVKIGDSYYLYGVDAKSYIPWNYGWGGCRVNSAATGTPAKVTLLPTGQIKLNRGYVNLQTANGEYARVNNYSTPDAGNVFDIKEITGSYFDPTEAKAKVEEALAYYTKQVFTIQGNRGAWTVDVENNKMAPTHKGSTTTDGNVTYGEELEAINAENPNQQWAFVLNEGNVYLYNVGQKKFIVNNGDVTNLAAHDATPVNISWGNSNNPFWLLIDDGTNTINNNNSGALGFGSWYSADDGNKVTFTKIADFDDTEAIAQLGVQRYDVTFNLLDENGGVIKNLVKDYAEGEVVSEIPAELKADYYEYGEVTPMTVTEEGDNTVNITATWTGPFKISDPTTEPYWYFLTIRNYAYAIKGLNETESEIRTYSVEDVLNDQLWSFTGNNIDGFSIYNKKVGKYLTGPAQDANSLYSSLSDDATPMWKLIQIEGGKFEINRVGTQRVLNQLGGADIERFQRLGYWVHSTTDAGGHFNVADPIEMVEGVINEWLNAPDGIVYGLTDEAKDAVRTELGNLGEEPSVADLTRVYTGIADKDKVELTTGFYALVNKAYGTVLSVTPEGVFNASSSIDGSAEAQDLGMIFKITKGQGNAVTFSSQGLYIPQLATSTQTKGSEESAEGAVVHGENSLTAAFDFRGTELDDEYCCMHIAGAAQTSYNKYDLVGWTANADASQWYIYPVEGIHFRLNALGEDEYYATLYLPFAVDVEGADEIDIIYAVANEQAERQVVESTTIPANTPVIIKSSSEYVTLTPSLEDGEPIEGNILQGTFLEIPTPQNGYIFSGIEGQIGFYANALDVVPANKCYIVSDEGSPKYIIDFSKTGIGSAKADLKNVPVYDLQGRRVEKPGKGIYIVNGKKVQFK